MLIAILLVVTGTYTVIGKLLVYAGAIFIQQAIGWNTYLSKAILLVVTGVFTVIGKL